jgi:GWxTD domain-containing protein
MSMPIASSFASFDIWIHSPVARALGWALAHFVWEGAAIAMILAVALAIFPGSSARLRYGLACAALVAMPIVFGVTFAVSLPHSPARTIIRIPLPEPSRVQFENAPPAPPESWKFSSLAAWAAPLWLTGVLGLLLYRFASWIAAQRLRRRGTSAAPKEWSRYVASLAVQLNISRPVALLESYLAEVPMVIGYLRPVILAPIGMLAGLPFDQVEAILLHELAHIRRTDYLVNLAQTMIESLLFYHPAVWWISNVVRAERENCCDDFVLARDTDPRAYAAALLAMEQSRREVDHGAEPRVKHGPMALAANGGHLLKRVRRILGTPRKPATPDSNLAIGPVALAIVGAGIALAAWQPEIVKKSEVPKPEIGRLAPHLSAKAQSEPQRIQGTINGLPAAARPQAIKELQPLIDRANAVLDHATLIAQAQQPQPMTDQKKQQQEQKLRQELESPYRKWLNEDAVYIITDAERKAFLSLTTDFDREQFIEQFWKRRDPTPDTERNEYREEHYRRIAYANEHFKSAIPGWKTDRGRIYIEYGPPDEIESHPSGGSYQRPQAQGGGTTTTYPFEQWRYRYIEGLGNNIIMEFVDTAKNGEYRLTTNPSEKDVPPKDPAAGPAAGQPIQIVQGGPPTELDRVRAQETVQFFADGLAALRTKYAEDHPDVVAARAKLDQARRNQAAIANTSGFGNKHSGVLIYSGGHVTFVIPLDGPGPFHVYGRVRTADGTPIAAFEDNANAGQLNYVGTFTLKPGSYILSAARKSRETEGATETVTFEVK